MLQRPYCGGLLSLLAVSHPPACAYKKKQMAEEKVRSPDIEEASHREIEQDWEEAEKAERKGEAGLIRVGPAPTCCCNCSAHILLVAFHICYFFAYFLAALSSFLVSWWYVVNHNSDYGCYRLCITSLWGHAVLVSGIIVNNKLSDIANTPTRSAACGCFPRFCGLLLLITVPTVLIIPYSLMASNVAELKTNIDPEDHICFFVSNTTVVAIVMYTVMLVLLAVVIVIYAIRTRLQRL
eukprot:g46306.t1